jgi:hypothetical protein
MPEVMVLAPSKVELPPLLGYAKGVPSSLAKLESNGIPGL